MSTGKALGAIVGATMGVVTATILLHAIYGGRHPSASAIASLALMGLMIGCALGVVVGWDDRA